MVFNFLFANEYLESIYDNVVLKNSKEAIKSVEKLSNDIKNDNFKNVKKEFSEVVRTWKSVESFYLLGDLNDEYLDTPRYLDTFHHGNEDIKVQLDRIIADSEDLSISLYKNSHKTINALEYILFTKDLKIKRVKNISLAILSKMGENLKDIYSGYEKARADFIKDEQVANAIMLNSLIENSYKLKEWRIGDASGLSRKYKGKPDNKRAEYALSKNSQLAIKSILDTHLSILGKSEFKNYGDLIKSYDINDELNDAIKYLDGSLKKLNLIDGDDFSKAKPLYKQTKKLHATYYITLIGKLKVTAKVLDADGD
jgi:hypothetical protein